MATKLNALLAGVSREIAVQEDAEDENTDAAKDQAHAAETQATARDEASAEATVEDEAAPTGRVRRRTNGARRRAS